MAKLLVFLGSLLIGSLLIPTALWLGPIVIPPSPIVVPTSQPVVWKWSDEKATINYCANAHLPDYDVTTDSIRTKTSSRSIYVTQQRHTIVFTRSEGTLFIAEFHPIATGCRVVAIKLATGRLIWETQLQGIGPTCHSKYRNRVNIETDGGRVIVYGNESHGKYVEQLDGISGKMLLNQKFVD
jgi:hypothetical protein